MTASASFVARADRILDAAGELLMRLGYRKVTIEDIARRAKIGKGTVYLHWRAKDELFAALLARESMRLTERFVAVVRADPGEVRPHRLMRLSYVITLQEPLLLAMVTADAEILGRLSETTVNKSGQVATDLFFDVLIKNGLLRDDVPNMPYALRAATAGFFTIDRLDPDIELAEDARADALAHVIRSAFEPARQPGRTALTQAATAICAVLEDVIPPYREWIYRGKDDQ